MRRIGLMIGVSLMSVLMIGTQAAVATGTQDQSNSSAAWGSSGVFTTQSTGQVITPGVTGTLDSIQLFVDRNAGTGTLNVSIYNADGSGYPTGSPLASQSLDIAGLPAHTGTVSTPTSVTFSSPAYLTAGTPFVVVLSTSSSGVILSAWDSLGGYPGGKLIYSGAGPTWYTGSPVQNLLFTTYVTPSLGSEGPDLTPWHQAYQRASQDAACHAGWNPSWQQWPAAGTGGWVCERTVLAYAKLNH